MLKKLLYIPLLILIVVALMAPMTVRAEGSIEARLIAQSGDLTVGDPIPITLSVSHPQGYQVILPELESAWGDFLVNSISIGSTVSKDDGTEITTFDIDARLFAPGTFSTPPLPLTVSDGNGHLNEIVAPPVEVTITSVLVEGDSELRDIKPQAELPYRALLPWFIGGILVLIAAGVIYLWRRKRQARIALAKVDNRLPHEVAFDELDRIAKLDLPRFERFKEHYTLVSDCVRVYMERTYQVPVLERTTSEIRESLRKSSVMPDVSHKFVHFLDECDLVKFSKFKPDGESAYQILADARLIVEETKSTLPDGEDDSETIENINPGANYSPGKPNTKAEVSV